MAFEILAGPEDRYVIVRVVGAMSRGVAMQTADAAWVLARKIGVKCFLYDLRQSRNIESMAANYRLAYEELPAMHIDRHSAVALLTAPEDRPHDFIETVMQNAGYQVRIFTDESAAVAWLADRRPR